MSEETPQPEVETQPEETSFKQKRGPRSKEVTFARPPFANEIFTDENARKLDTHPGWSRHFIKQYIQTGDLSLAAKQANISKEVEASVDTRLAKGETVKEFLSQYKMGAEDLAAALYDCVQATTLMKDKHGRIHKGVDLKTRLQAIELIMKLTGEISPQKKEQKGLPAVDLFSDVDPEKKD